MIFVEIPMAYDLIHEWFVFNNLPSDIFFTSIEATGYHVFVYIRHRHCAIILHGLSQKGLIKSVRKLCIFLIERAIPSQSRAPQVSLTNLFFTKKIAIYQLRFFSYTIHRNYKKFSSCFHTVLNIHVSRLGIVLMRLVLVNYPVNLP